jgi:hypothetical protein
MTVIQEATSQCTIIHVYEQFTLSLSFRKQQVNVPSYTSTNSSLYDCHSGSNKSMYHHTRLRTLTIWVCCIFCELFLLFRVINLMNIMSLPLLQQCTRAQVTQQVQFIRQHMITVTRNNVPVAASHPKRTSLLSGSHDQPHTGMARNCHKWIRSWRNINMNVG